jgi:hypothetical protein
MDNVQEHSNYISIQHHRRFDLKYVDTVEIWTVEIQTSSQILQEI